MKKRIVGFALFFITIFTSLHAQQTINQEKSVIDFQITGGGIFKVKGTFTGMQGDFNLNSNALENANFDICVDAASINTKNKKRDDHLRSSDFLDIEKFKNICFVSSAVTKTENGFKTIGNLTIHGVTKIVEIPFTFTNNTFVGHLTVNRFDYNIGDDFSTIRVGKEATVTITCIIN
ncbi:YceI family protein [Lacinutrix sp. C3R15]|uniref:YceI family protein n=1 Tax=Flavobacteriaceae TaxID=49546 RepID=UPI001C086BF8|nr:MULTISPECIES: YceI family protein [Flavobacteriaceae]MBU2939706.1 YceI family protein [Lacinutrix sp. C3R15]MDO6623021.1 YceI family protein [Oceanihabitans sp. 1_MG-2023]